MSRFRIEFEGRTAASQAEVDAALELVRARLAELWIAEPAVGSRVADVYVEIAFVLESPTTQAALDGGHALLSHVTADTALTDVGWTAARAEIIVSL